MRFSFVVNNSAAMYDDDSQSNVKILRSVAVHAIYFLDICG